MIVPPPMSAHTVEMKSSISMLSFGGGKNQHNVITYLSSCQFMVIKYDSDGTYCNKDVIMNEPLPVSSLRCLTWWKEDTVVVVADHDGGNSIMFLEIKECEENFKLSLR